MYSLCPFCGYNPRLFPDLTHLWVHFFRPGSTVCEDKRIFSHLQTLMTVGVIRFKLMERDTSSRISSGPIVSSRRSHVVVIYLPTFPISFSNKLQCSNLKRLLKCIPNPSPSLGHLTVGTRSMYKHMKWIHKREVASLRHFARITSETIKRISIKIKYSICTYSYLYTQYISILKK
jgi:hypothetical protein